MEKQEKKLEEQEAVPLCINCLKPFSPEDHYCKNCGEVVGTYTQWMPFVNIRVFTNSVKNAWKKLFYEKNVSFGLKLCIVLYLFVSAPLVLIGLPFTLWYKYRNKV